MLVGSRRQVCVKFTWTGQQLEEAFGRNSRRSRLRVGNLIVDSSIERVLLAAGLDRQPQLLDRIHEGRALLHQRPSNAAERPSSAVAGATEATRHKKPSCLRRLLQRLVRRLGHCQPLPQQGRIPWRCGRVRWCDTTSTATRPRPAWSGLRATDSTSPTLLPHRAGGKRTTAGSQPPTGPRTPPRPEIARPVPPRTTQTRRPTHPRLGEPTPARSVCDRRAANSRLGCAHPPSPGGPQPFQHLIPPATLCRRTTKLSSGGGRRSQ